ncbi:MAG TPA: alpha-glucan family phosphorylase, partial [Chloroflexota bacterium]|nr:alpha-glucan family phosphorylase [Chloroflexota bacterium]
RSRLEQLCSNLAATWNGGQEILAMLQALSPGAEVSPWEILHETSDSRLEELFPEAAEPQLDSAALGLKAYLSQATWYDRACRDDEALARLRTHPVAYFCAEFGLTDWLQIFSGGLGVLAGDVLKEASDMGLPLVGVGLLYRAGFFHQELDDAGFQRETYRDVVPDRLPLSSVKDADGETMLLRVPMGKRTVDVRAWKLAVGRTILYLLDADTEENQPEDRLITANLYGGDQDMRIRQEVILGIGGVQLLETLGVDPGVYSMNEGHAAFLGVALLARCLRQGMDAAAALRAVRNRCVYTNHTVIAAGNDVFPLSLVREYLGPYVESTSIGLDRLLELGTQPGVAGFAMAMLAFGLSGRANAVSRIHAEAIHRNWAGFEVEAVTNGVHVPTWLGSEMRELLDRCVPGWRSDSPEWERIMSIPDQELWAAHEKQRRRLVKGVEAASGRRLDPTALTMVWARRFAEYKRAGLIASDLDRLAGLFSDSNRPLQLILAGKSHPKDEGGKAVLHHLLQALESREVIAPRVAFIPDYDIDTAGSLTAGADLWLNTPRKPLEASGTSGMKASDNGALQLTVRDGWAAEVDWYRVGWGIEGRDDGTDAADLYAYLEQSIIPTFYERGPDGVPHEWVAMMKRSMLITLRDYSTRRMMKEYLETLYLPLIRAQTSEGD